MTNAPLPALNDIRVAVIGLGYVGLPLAVAFGQQRATVGYDLNASRVAALQSGTDSTGEVDDLASATHLTFSSDLADIAGCNVYIVAVPTPIDNQRQPNLAPLLAASRAIGSVIKRGDIVIYESTVYPGATEEVCVPVLEETSGLSYNQDFYCGYSPERINPGDKERRLPTIRKVTSGSTPEIAAQVDAMYASIITAGTYQAESIRVAEAAKVIENTQRDLNIALVNELSIIFNRLGIDTQAVLEAAGTKWNFLPFRPGLVGGHCIGVDPYYLTHKAEAIGYHPQVILAGRRINDGMGAYVAGELVKAMLRDRIHVQGARILVLGLAFKENCPDLRNSRVIDVVDELRAYNAQVDVHDPLADAGEAKHEYDIDLVSTLEPDTYDAVLLAVAHEEYRAMGADGIRALGHDAHIFFDLKSVFDGSESDLRL